MWFRASKLMRLKWERADYRERTLAAAASALAKEKKQKLTDLGNARRYTEAGSGSIRWSMEEGCWHSWEGRCFERDHIPSVTQLAEQVISQLFAEADAMLESKPKTALYKHALKLESRGRYEAMLSLAKGLPGVSHPRPRAGQ